MDNIPNINIVTYATHNQGYFDALKKSCKDNGNNLVVVGWNKKWKGFTDKFDGMMKYLEDQNDNDISIFVDAFDVINLENAETIYKKFKKFDKPIVFANDNHSSNILIHIISNITFPEHGKFIINSGTYIGYNWALKQLFTIIKEYSLKTNETDDQRILNSLYKNNKTVQQLSDIDIEGDIFFVVIYKSPFDFITGAFNNIIYSNINHETILKNIIFNPLTNRKPSFIHGVNNMNMNQICNKLNLPIMKHTKKYNYHVTPHLKFIINYYIIKNLSLIVCVIILICLLIMKIRKHK